ncbi:MAG: hypothetical protein A2X99_10475 [Deltaproteobacteria bacterium GWB2_55_19]|nr:MAG: hypothetical protein A2X99_10475 [Deltaproteobacteria bacterium GWB2_55_19]
MPRNEDAIRLRHMLEAARAARGYVGSKTREDFFKDNQCRDAVVRCIEVIGEAASRLSQECQTEFPQIPWKNIISMRNRLIHAYYDINIDTVWSTVTEDLPPLITELEKIL